MEQITVLGIGNILMQDEGFGVRVVEELTRRYRFPDQVQVLDGGTLGMELLRFIRGTDQLIVIDAVSGGSEPGAFYHFANEEVTAYFKQKVSMHELGIQDVLMALKILEQPVKNVVVLGVEPAVIDVGLELSSQALTGVRLAVDKTLEILSSWQVTVEPKQV